jgi:hypothetical protein
MRILAAVLDTEAAEAAPFPGSTPGLVRAAWLRDHLDPRHRRHVGSGRDAWGGAVLYWSDGRNYMLLSLGSDGEPQFDYSAAIPFMGIPRASTGSDSADDLLVVNGVAWRGPTSPTEMLVESMADIRTIGTALESYAIDYNVYPGPVSPIEPVESIESDLSPVYIRVLPKVDPWTAAYLFWSGGSSYAVVGLGSDGVADPDYAAWGGEEFQAFRPGPITSAGADIVFVDGQFVQWPAVLPRAPVTPAGS